jgi:hypothetical protein
MGQIKQRFEKYDVDVLPLKGTYVSNPEVRRTLIRDGEDLCFVEEYACRHFRRLGYSALRVENEPFFVLFSVFMSPLIQDASDPHGQIVGFPDRRAFDEGTRGKIIWTRVPDDFGKPEYGMRRAEAIEKHLSALSCQSQELRRMFDLWLGPSEDLGQYLWGHRSEQLKVARQFIEILPPGSIINSLRYLIEDYWGRRAGWPDLLIFREKEFFFVEVKSATDKLGKSQQRWLRDNRERLHFPFKLVEIHRKVVQPVHGG